jgi:hypothetical protein
LCFLIKRKKTYHLQAKVPNELAEVLGRGDLSLTLYTQELSRASRMRAHLDGRFETAFRKIKSRRWEVDMVIKTGELTRANIRKLLRDFVKAGLDDFEREQATGRPGNHGTVDDDLEGLDVALDQSRMALSMRRHVEFMGPHLIHLLEDAGLKPEGVGLDKGTEAYQFLCRDMLKASIRVIEANMGRLTAHFEGNDLNTVLKDLDLHEGDPESIGRVSAAGEPSTAPEPPIPISHAPELQSLLVDFEHQKVESGKWRESTVRNHRPKMNAMLQVFGENRPVDQITVQDVREFAKLLELLPPGFALKGYGDLAGVTSNELEGKHDQTLDITTRREYLNFTKSVFEFALENEYVTKNPVISGIIPSKKSNTREQRVPFSREDLERIFDPRTYQPWSEGQPSRQFIPLLALFTGSRLEELANLNTADVFRHEESDLWCIDHNMENGRHLKNQNAIRTIPLHPVLVDRFKFPLYVKSLEKGNHLDGG